MIDPTEGWPLKVPDTPVPPTPKRKPKGGRENTALEPQIQLDPEEEWGQAMSKLTDTRKRVVLAYIELGCRNKERACELAGVGGTEGARKKAASILFRNPLITAAIDEVRKQRYGVQAVRAQERLFELIESDNQKIAIEAAKEVIRLAGDSPVTEHKVTVEHVETRSTEELIAFVRKYQESLPKIAHAKTEAVDAEFTEVKEAA